MTATFLGAFTSGTAEWDAMRAGRVGASDIGVIVGVSPYESRAQLLHRKAGLLALKARSKAMERGDLLESAILTYLQAKYDATIDQDLTGTWVDEADERLSCTPDGITTDGLLFEAKSTSDRATEHGWGKAGTDQIPDHYLCQVTWCCGLLDLPEWRVGVLSGATNGRPDLAFSAYKGRFDPDLYTHLRREANRFLGDLENLTEKEAAA